MSAAADPQIAAIVEAGGGHLPALLADVEQQLLVVADLQGEPLGEYARATISAGGKRLRPLLVALSAGPPPEERHDQLVRAAAAVELVHVATLVHDDVLDDASLRRGRPTVYAEAGREAAVQTGDALFASAFSQLLESEDEQQVAALATAGSALAEGELMQRSDAWDVTIGLDRYVARCELKTARLFEAACALGSLVRGEEAGALQPFARAIGLAFQMLDDVLDVEGPAERTGKHRGTDLLDGTVTLPLLIARDRDKQLADLDLRGVNTPARAEALCELITDTGATEVAREVALGYVIEAKAAIPQDERAEALSLVADSVVARYS